jgi:hypothetical protein
VKQLKIFRVTIKGETFEVNAENETQAKWAAVALSVKRGDCTDAEYRSTKFEKIVEVSHEVVS